MRIYAIGDIHGHLEKLHAAHALIEADRQAVGDGGSPVVHVGDLVDRGPDSRGVIEHLIRGIGRGAKWVVLKGNHDRMFAAFLADPRRQDPVLRAGLNWLHPNLGGATTLASYGVAAAADRPPEEFHAEALARVPQAHVDFLTALPLTHEAEGALFVHAGIRPGVPLTEQVEDDLVWIRAAFLDDPRDHGRLVVHGHTVIDAATHYGNRVNLDSGAAFGGPLSAVVIEGREVCLLTREGRALLRPVSPHWPSID